MEHEKNTLLPQRNQETRNRETPDKREQMNEKNVLQP